MPFPAEVQTVRVVGQYLDATGKPMTAQIQFTPSVEAVGSGVVVAAGASSVRLDSEGKFRIDLAATTNSGLEPGGWVYQVLELLSGATRKYQIELDPDVSEVNIDDLIPVTTTPTAERFATKPYVDQAVSTLTSSVAGKVSKAGDSMTGPLVLVGSPTVDLHAATKQYVDTGIAGAITTAAQDANQRASQRVAKTGDTMSGSLVLAGGSSDLTVGGRVTAAGGVSASKSVDVGSTFAGGENTYDSTGRINLSSWQRWQKHPDGNNTDEAHYGEVIRMGLMRDNAKAVIAWRDHFTDPAKPYTLFGIVGHYEANDGNSVHGHVSFEVPDQNLELQTRLEIRYVDDNGNIGTSQSLIKTSDARLVVGASNGSLHIAGGNSISKNMYFNTNSLGQDAGKRWGIQTDTTTEAGANVGSDLRINSYNDGGTFKETSLFVKRSTSQVGIGGIVNPQAKLDVQAAGSYHTVQAAQTTTSGVNYAAYSAVLGSAANRYFDGRLLGDGSGRIVIKGDGSINLGPGDGSGQDVYLGREAANVLRTDDRLVVGGNIAGVDSYANLPKGVAGRSNNAGIIIGSSYAGGDDDGTGTDSTGRINLYSYQRANVGSFGENIRNFIMRSDAKTMQAFYMPVQTANKKGGYDGTTRDPMTSGVSWKPVVWQGAHYEANSHASVHGHWELEIADANGQLQGRLEIPFIDQSTTAAMTGDIANVVVGVDYTNIRTNLADFSVRAQNIISGPYSGQNTALRVGGNNGVNKDILLSISSDMQNSGRRWIGRANTDTESGGNAGTNFQLIRCADDGTTLGSALFIERKTGYITSGASGPAGAKLALIWGASGTQGVSVQPSSSPGSAAGFDAVMTATTDRAYQANVVGDSSRRIVIFADGKVELGDGATRDTNLYRASAGRLKTDTNFHVGGQLGVGSVPNGTDAVTVVLASDSNALNLTNTTAGGNTSAPLIRGEAATTASLILTTRVAGDSASRFLLTPDGKMQWGDGSAAKDTALYRSAAGTLKTDTKLYVGTTLGVGAVPDATNKLSVVQAADANTINSVNTVAGGNVNQPHIYLESATASSVGTSMRVTGDTASRALQLASGELQWGPGNAARDTKLYRSAPQTMTLEGSMRVTGDLRHLGSTLGFYNGAGVSKPTVTGSRDGNAALASLLTALSTLGLLIDSTTA